MLVKCFQISFCRNLSIIAKNMLGPTGVRTMKDLDREQFVCNLAVPVLYVNENNLSKIIHCSKKYFLKLENFKPVQNCDMHSNEGNRLVRKCIYLNPDKIKTWTDFAENDRSILEKIDINESSLQIKQVQFSYENWSPDQVFKSVLPETEESVSGWSQIGHIIHLNLKDHLLAYKFLIGQVLVDKIKTCRTVVNKSNIIDNTYRNFSMEVLAGDDDFMVTVKENRCTFEFDFSKVYWNPRLGKEHERILELLKPNEILFDVFCGVGPFAIPAAKKKCKVYANDLNPDSFKWLNNNAKINKVDQSLFKTFNLDGKDFICDVIKKYLIDLCEIRETDKEEIKIHITMNLPGMAVDFLKYFNKLIDNAAYYENFNCDIIVHVYCFAVGDDPKNVAIEMVEQNIHNICCNIIEVFDVRNVSPKKEMIRVSFHLTKDILFEIDCDKGFDKSSPPKKKLCMKTE